MAVRLDRLCGIYKRTKVYNISFKCIPVDFVAVELNEGPIFCVPFGTSIKGDGRGERDVTEDALTIFAPVLRDFVVEFVEGFDRLLLLHQLALDLRPLLCTIDALDDGLHSVHAVELLTIIVCHNLVFSDLAHGRFEERLERFVAEEKDFVTRLTRIRELVQLVIPCTARENDMPGAKNVYLVAVAAFGYVDSSSTFNVGRDSGSNP